MWELEIRNAGRPRFYTWQRGTLEECLSEMFSLKEGGRIELYAMRLTWSSPELDAMRLTWSSGELEPSCTCLVVHGLVKSHASSCPARPSSPELPVQHQHVWHEDLGMMVWKCVYEEGCPARITWEELHRSGMAATADTLNELWEAKQ